ncbi:MAG: tetratricopeptide repeat protein [Sphingobacteriaceae bacterium]|nr:tetratricopeptide repeat protein [Sphingobacteriaceae bacterium]
MRVIFFLLLSSSFFAQPHEIDSLKAVIQKQKADSNLVNQYHVLASKYFFVERDSAMHYILKSKLLAEKLNYKRGLSNAFFQLGYADYQNGNFFKTIEHWNASLALKNQMNDKSGVAKVLGSLGAVYISQSNFPKALELCNKALFIYDSIQDQAGSVYQLGNIAIIHQYNKDYNKAIETYKRVVDICLKLNDERGLALQYGNLGSAYHAMKEFTTAIEYVEQALSLFDKMSDMEHQALMLTTLGACYENLGELDKAMDYHFKSIAIAEKNNYQMALGLAYFNMGNIELKQKKYKDAQNHLAKCLSFAKSGGNLEQQSNVHKSLSFLDSLQGNFKGAFLNHRLYKILEDSIYNENKRKDLTRIELNYEFQKKEMANKAEQDLKDAVYVAEHKKQKMILALVSGILFILGLFAIFIFRSLKTTRKQKMAIEVKNKETELQKKIIEEKNKDITDSIIYAKRIQKAMMPNDVLIQKNLIKLKKNG